MKLNTRNLLSLPIFLFALYSCKQDAAETKSGRQAASQDKTIENSGSEEGSEDKNEGPESSNGEGTQSAVNPGGTPSGGGRTGGTAIQNPEEYFEKVVLEVFALGTPENGSCDACHVERPFNPPSDPGPTTIYDYEQVKNSILRGTPESNPFVTTMLGTGHGAGGDQCGGSIENSPCKEVVAFGQKLVDAGESLPTQTVPGLNANNYGELTLGDWNANMQGFAVNPADATDYITVEFYNGPFDQGGTMLGSSTADRVGPDNFTEGFHAFSFKIPDANLQDGQENTIHAYAVVGGVKHELGGSPLKTFFYVPKAEQYYTNNVLPNLSNCLGCHAERSYLGAMSILVSPKPSGGGTATNNVLYNKCNGQNHGGGNVCNGTLNQALQNWWAQEFQ